MKAIPSIVGFDKIKNGLEFTSELKHIERESSKIYDRKN